MPASTAPRPPKGPHQHQAQGPPCSTISPDYHSTIVRAWELSSSTKYFTSREPLAARSQCPCLVICLTSLLAGCVSPILIGPYATSFFPSYASHQVSIVRPPSLPSLDITLPDFSRLLYSLQVRSFTTLQSRTGSPGISNRESLDHTTLEAPHPHLSSCCPDLHVYIPSCAFHELQAAH